MDSYAKGVQIHVYIYIVFYFKVPWVGLYNRNVMAVNVLCVVGFDVALYDPTAACDEEQRPMASFFILITLDPDLGSTSCTLSP